MTRTVNVGTIGHIDHGKATLTSLLLAVAAAGLLSSAPPAVMPTRRQYLEPGFDMNDLLVDPGDRQARKRRKADRQDRLREVQAKAITGARL